MYVHILRSTNKLQGIGVAIEKEGLETDWPNCTAGETTGPGEKKSCFFQPCCLERRLSVLHFQHPTRDKAVISWDTDCAARK